MTRPVATPNVRQALEAAGAHYMNLIEFGILKLFIDFKVFDNIPPEGDISIKELASKTNGDESLIRRFSDYLIASDVLASPSPDHVAHTDRSVSYRSGEIAGGFISHVYHFFLRPMATWTSYFEKNGFSEPKDANVIPLGLATGHPAADLYEILNHEPKLAFMFNAAQARSAAIYPIKDVYDFGWMQPALLSGDRPAIVDVGGSHGLALKEILGENGFIPAAKCAVLDLPKTIKQAQDSLDESLRSVQFVGGSMLEPFPSALNGAALYQFRRVLSDFVDKDIVLALKNAKNACAPDSRVLLIEELVKPGRGKFAIAQDVSVLNFGGKRRSENDWCVLAEQADLRINNLYEREGSEFAVLELTLA